MPSLLCFSLYKLQWLAKRLVRSGQEKNYVKSTHHVQYSGNCVGHKLFLYIILKGCLGLLRSIFFSFAPRFFSKTVLFKILTLNW
jgi:hypothetical protein